MHILQSNFTAGELAPSLGARVEFEKYSQGCRTLKNFLVQPHGGAVKRPGFVLLDALPGEAVLLEFIFNVDQAYCLVFGERWLRVAQRDGFILNTQGGIFQIASPYTLAQAKTLSSVQSADILFLACQGVAPHKLKRYGHADWRFEAMNFAEPLPAPAWNSREVVNSWSEYNEAYAPGVLNRNAYERKGGGDTAFYVLINDLLYTKTDKSQTVTVPAVEFINDAKNSDGSLSKAQLVTPYTYYLTSVDNEGRESNLSAGAGITGPSINNWQAGDYMILRWFPVSGAVEYRIYKASFGGRPGYIGTAGGLEYKDYNVASSLTEGAPKYVDPFPDGDYPSTVCLFEQRLVFASTPKRPQTIWMSKSGDYANFAGYTPVTADSPIELTIAGQEVSAVNWMIPLRSLILGTSGVEWEISSIGDNAFSAKSARVKPQSYWGSSLKKALIIGNIILHVSSSGSQIRNLQYDFGSDSYGGADLSILAAHLLEKNHITDWCFQKTPDSIVWAVRDDGILLGLTFQSEHKVTAWHRHKTDGRFKAVCSIPHKQESSLFAVTLRGSRHYLERMADRYSGGDPARAVFCDCAITYDGPTATTLSGLEHLNGKVVVVLSNGAVEAPRKVVNGKIQLDSPSSLVTVGLPYQADLETMPVEIVTQNGTSVTLKKYINVVNILLKDSMGITVGSKFEETKLRSSEPYGHPPKPFSGIKSVTLPNLAENSVTICIRSEDPTPVTVLALVSQVDK